MTLLTVRPFRRIRLGSIRSEILGHFISGADLVLYERSLRGAQSNYDVIVLPRESANRSLSESYSRAFEDAPGTYLVRESGFLTRLLLKASRGLEVAANRSALCRLVYCGPSRIGGIDECGIHTTGRPYIALDERQTKEATKGLAALGLDVSQPYVCIALRNPDYWRTRDAITRGIGKTGSSQDFRNVDFAPYREAIDWLLSAGYQVVRTGAVATSPWPIHHDRFVDYPLSGYRSEELDILLHSKCEFMWAGGASGVMELALAFNRPVLVTDLRPFHWPSASASTCIVMPSMVSDSEAHLLSLEDMVSHPALDAAYYGSRGLHFLPNSPAHLLAAAQQMVESVRADNDPIDVSPLEKCFWNAYREADKPFTIHPDGKGEVAVRHDGLPWIQFPRTYQDPRLVQRFLLDYQDVLLPDKSADCGPSR